MMDTLSEVLDRLGRAGYDADFYPADGLIACSDCDDRVDPATLVVDEVVRFEGQSDPDDEAIVYALSGGPCGRRGTFTSVYGPGVGEDDLAIALVLRDLPHQPPQAGPGAGVASG